MVHGILTYVITCKGHINTIKWKWYKGTYPQVLYLHINTSPDRASKDESFMVLVDYCMCSWILVVYQNDTNNAENVSTHTHIRLYAEFTRPLEDHTMHENWGRPFQLLLIILLHSRPRDVKSRDVKLINKS